ncbi:MAG: hypothetical protein KDJ69_12025 [Nitratireductor sp.]|nr:hypothetical protein [Nitratireductor sp.]
MSASRVAEFQQHSGKVLWNIAVAMVYAAVIMIAVEYSFYRLMPMSFWLWYENVRVLEPAVEGTKLTFQSFSEVNRRSNVRWTDTLYCDLHDGNGFRNHASQIAHRDGVDPSGLSAKNWTFHPLAPTAGSTCAMISSISLLLPYGIEKRQVIDGYARDQLFDIQPKGSL